MSAPANLDWLFLTLGYTFAAAGALLLAWALLWDRSKDRRRCPKCWYDMAGVPGLQCPECGRSARAEPKLHKTRRRPVVAAMAMLLMLAAFTATRIPRFRDRGWPGALPTTALIWLAPVAPRPIGPDPILWGLSSTPWRTPAPTHRERLHDETWRRLLQGEMAHWQSQVYLNRLFRSNPLLRPDQALLPAKPWTTRAFLPASVDLSLGLTLELRRPRGQWVAGMSADFPRIMANEWSSRWESRNAQTLIYWLHPPPEAGTVPLELRLCAGRQVVYTTQTSAVLAQPPSPDPVLTPINSMVANANVFEAMRPNLNRTQSQIQFDDSSSDPTFASINFLVSFVAEVRSGNRVVARGISTLSGHRPQWRSLSTCPLSPVDGAQPSDWKPPLTLVIRGDADLAANANPLFRPELRAKSCWTGQFTIPVDDQ